MRIAKWMVVFAFAFLVAWILIFTFTQEPFSMAVPVLLLGYRTPPIPIYAYVASAFGIGLLIGFFAAAYYYLVGQAGIRSKKRQIKGLEQELARVNGELELLKSAQSSQEKKDFESETDAPEEPPQI